jgi:hypothetical protein
VNRAGRGSLISEDPTDEMPENSPKSDVAKSDEAKSDEANSDEVARLRQELAVSQDKLEAAEWALAHLGSATKPLAQRVQKMVEQAVAEAQHVRAEARTHVETLVAEAEQLRNFARQGAESSAKHARQEVVDKAGAMLEDAKNLRATAEKQAAQHLRAAQARYQEVKARADDLQRSAERTLAEATERKAELDRQVAEARERAAAILRVARTEAEARSRELIALAQKQLHIAQQEGERILRAAERASRPQGGNQAPRY